MEKRAIMEQRAMMNLSWPALDDAVHDGQRLFRQVLSAMSEPGTLHEITAPTPTASPVGAALWGTVLTLCDLDTTIWIAADLASPELREALIFHTGARLVDDPASADFALLTHQSFDPQAPFALGSDLYPDRSTTLLVVVERLENAEGWRLSGPGIAESRQLDIGEPRGCRALMDRLAANRGTFPRGLDVVLGCGSRLAAIPRSTRIERSLTPPSFAQTFLAEETN